MREEDRCAYCGSEIGRVPDVAWRGMKSDEGILLASNFCKNAHCAKAAEREAPHVIAYQRIRQRVPE